MLGALEVKAIVRLARKCGADWKPLHSAVLDCLLAHRNRKSGHCFPDRALIAAHSNVSQRTVDRAIEQLVGWGALDREQPKAVTSGQFRPRQFTFLFELPLGSAAGHSGVSRPEDTQVSHGRKTNLGFAVGQNDGCNKEEGKEQMQGKGQKRKDRAPDKQTRFDFDIPTAVLEVRAPTTGELALKMAEYTGIPLSDRNLAFVKLGLEAEIKYCGCEPREAASTICERVIDDRNQGVVIDRFYFEDAKWRRPNANQRLSTRLERELEINRRRRQAG